MQFKKSELATYFVNYFNNLKSVKFVIQLQLIDLLCDDLESNQKFPPVANRPHRSAIIEMIKCLRDLTSIIAISKGDTTKDIDSCLLSLLANIKTLY